MLKKRIIGTCLCMGMAVSSVPAFAAEAVNTKDVTVSLNEEKLEFDVEPVIENGRTMVPFRKIFEELDCAVCYWEHMGNQLVAAQRGTDQILLTIGQKTMVVNGEEITLDTEPKIVNGRTLVPLRAISEGLGCTVKWVDDTKTAAIYEKYGQYSIKSKQLEKIVKLENGVTLLCISCVYPIIDVDKDDFFADLNKYYREKAENYIKDIEEKYSEAAKKVCNEMGMESYFPMEFCLSYKVDLNRMDWLSITTYDYRETEEEQTQTLESKNYQMILEKELSLLDVFGCEPGEENTIVKDAFADFMKINPEAFDATALEEIGKKSQDVNFYLTEDALVMCFNKNQIANATSNPTVAIPYADEKGLVKLDMSNANLDKLEFELEGNPTTGYTWEIISVDSRKLDVKADYIAGENSEGLVGAGGKYKFTVVGIEEGNTLLKCAYMRSFEGEGSITKTVTYKLYVTNENKITVLEVIEDVK